MDQESATLSEALETQDFRESIDWQGHQILVPPLHLSITVNKKRERWDRVSLMQEYLTKAKIAPDKVR
ncbi:MAG: hypothetical protein LHW56_04480 [Candidatus Cloacimonetes bacterium]|nr:hypothetical protein [Candidatus Cloacimonadota bacterium]MDY0172146.1 hypothetical protein [Candidatus Cloacimonadaceae bacterium]